MADLPPPPVNSPPTDAAGMLSPEWVRWFALIAAVLRDLSTRVKALEDA